MALIMSIGVMTVLGISSVTLIEYTTSNSKAASRSKQDQGAYGLAEAGINNAMAVLSKQGNNTLSPTLLPATTSTYENETVVWSGTLDQNTGIWSLTSTGTTRNPNGPSSGKVRRTVTAKVKLTAQETATVPSQNAWNYVFVTSTADPSCDLTLPANYVWNASLYVVGDMCLGNGARVTGTGNHGLLVHDKLTLSTSTSAVGASGALVNKVQVKTGCRYASNPLRSPCTSADNVWATTLDSNPPVITTPVADFAGWYANAAPGPKFACTYKEGSPPAFENETTNPTRNNSGGTVNLTPSGSSYKCRVGPESAPFGELSWSHTAKVLTVHGTVYIDGSAQVSGPPGGDLYTYDGQGTLYLSGTFTVNSSMKFCVRASGGDCDWGGWNPNSDMLTIAAGNGTATSRDVSIGSSARFQGALYASYEVELASSSKAEGPLVTPRLQLGSGATSDPWDSVTAVPANVPGNTATYPKAESPTSFTG